jgi:MoaA/NifB/PqqE/SkfB family radical SAM enzyme
MSGQELTILWRGPLESCNYACAYCPFAKRHEDAPALARDRAALERFVELAAARREGRLSVLFTPWGEALIRPWYQEALARLSALPHLRRVAIQTNLSAPLGWVARAARDKLALWATWHPTQVSRARFLARCRELDRHGVRYSAGVVGLREHLDELEALRAELPPHVYLWVNAYKREGPGYYTPEERARIEAIDPLFPTNAVHHPSRGRACRAGHTVISVDGGGDVRRCHFVPDRLGNIYEPGWERALGPAPCPTATCGCYIGYAHLEHLALEQVYGAGLLERIPLARAWRPEEAPAP